MIIGKTIRSLAGLAALCEFFAVVATSSLQAAAPSGIEVPRFLGTKINVVNVEKSVQFYTQYLGLKVALRVGDAQKGEVLLTLNGDPENAKVVLYYGGSAPGPRDTKGTLENLIFTFVDLKSRVQALKAAGYPIEHEVSVTPPVAGVKSVDIAYTKDPDGILIELVQWNH